MRNNSLSRLAVIPIAAILLLISGQNLSVQANDIDGTDHGAPPRWDSYVWDAVATPIVGVRPALWVYWTDQVLNPAIPDGTLTYLIRDAFIIWESIERSNGLVFERTTIGADAQVVVNPVIIGTPDTGGNIDPVDHVGNTMRRVELNLWFRTDDLDPAIGGPYIKYNLVRHELGHTLLLDQWNTVPVGSHLMSEGSNARGTDWFQRTIKPTWFEDGETLQSIWAGRLDWSGPRGGFVIPVDKFVLLAPYIGLASTILTATIASTVYVKRVKRKKERQ